MELVFFIRFRHKTKTLHSLISTTWQIHIKRLSPSRKFWKGNEKILTITEGLQCNKILEDFVKIVDIIINFLQFFICETCI